jgi:hypothetical protein
LQDDELPLLSALTNDNAMHIEEIVAIVDRFQVEEIRNRVNEVFDDVTGSLIGCGNVCLKKIVALVMNDCEELLDKVFVPDWIDVEPKDSPVAVAVATIGDYLNDLKTNLMSFWCDKLISLVLEAVILRYTRSVIFRTTYRRPAKRPTKRVKQQKGAF